MSVFYDLMLLIHVHMADNERKGRWAWYGKNMYSSLPFERPLLNSSIVALYCPLMTTTLL